MDNVILNKLFKEDMNWNVIKIGGTIDTKYILVHLLTNIINNFLLLLASFDQS